MRRLLISSSWLGAFCLVSLPSAAQEEDPVARWNRPVAPFRILGNLHYVGTAEIAAYLVATPAGHVLLDGGFPETAPLVAASVEALGFRLADVEVLLNSHAHFDHAGGLAELKERSGALLAAMAGDVEALRTGHAQWGDFPAVAVDRVLEDGDRVELGGTVLVARRTAGHTPGCTTWTMAVEEAGKRYDVAFVCSPNALPEHRLVGNPDYPEIAADFERTFEVLRALPVDVFLGAHGSFFDLEGKVERLAAGEDGTVFVDPEGYRSFVESKERQFREELERQRAVR